MPGQARQRKKGCSPNQGLRSLCGSCNHRHRATTWDRGEGETHPGSSHGLPGSCQYPQGLTSAGSQPHWETKSREGGAERGSGGREAQEECR